MAPIWPFSPFTVLKALVVTFVSFSLDSEGKMLPFISILKLQFFFVFFSLPISSPKLSWTSPHPPSPFAIPPRRWFGLIHQGTRSPSKQPSPKNWSISLVSSCDKKLSWSNPPQGHPPRPENKVGTRGLVRDTDGGLSITPVSKTTLGSRIVKNPEKNTGNVHLPLASFLGVFPRSPWCQCKAFHHWRDAWTVKSWCLEKLMDGNHGWTTVVNG